MLIEKRELPVLAVNLIYIPAFTVWALMRLNYEFVIYAAVIVAFFGLILATQRRTRFGLGILWGLTLWGVLHMAGGLVPVGDGVLYGVVLVPLFRGESIQVLRYDQVVHALGFGVATLACHHLLRARLRDGVGSRAVLGVLVALMGMGLGALNEVVELVAVLILPQTGVGGYLNTAFDLLFNTLGAAAAAVWVSMRTAPASRTP